MATEYHRPLSRSAVALNATQIVLADETPADRRDGMRGNNPTSSNLLVVIVDRNADFPSVSDVRENGNWTYCVPPNGTWEDSGSAESKVGLILADETTGTCWFEELG